VCISMTCKLLECRKCLTDGLDGARGQRFTANGACIFKCLCKPDGCLYYCVLLYNESVHLCVCSNYFFL
jgi:hypothetical protein